MSFLSPLFLLAAAAAAVPLFLHLFQRHESRRIAFPALRYLLKTEKEHARRIRLRQLILLILRMAAVFLVVLAGARLFVRGRGEAHPPTAVAVVLDNSLSSGRVVGDVRVLDLLKEQALRAVSMAGPDDRIWVLRAGEPWDVAPPLDGPGATARIRATEPSEARGDLTTVVARARALVEAGGRPAREIHLLSDLQRTAFGGPGGSGGPPAGEVPVVAFLPEAAGDGPHDNRFIREVSVGGGLDPLANQRTRIVIRLDAGTLDAFDLPDPSGSDDDIDEVDDIADVDARPDAPTPEPVSVRVVTGERIRAAGSLRPGEELVLPLGPFAGGRVEGWVESDPDALRADDRRYFVFSARPPVAVERSGAQARFLDEALAVVEDASRVRRSAPGDGEVLLSTGGSGLETGGVAPAVIVPPSDPTVLPALNRRLASAGIPWRYEPGPDGGETRVEESRIPPELNGTRVARSYRVRPATDGGDGDGQTPSVDVLARLASGDPFLLEGRTVAGRRYLLLAAPLDPGWTDLPVSAPMVPLLEWALSRWARTDGGSAPVLAGEGIPTPPGATTVEDPSGERHPVDGTRTFRRTGRAGIYRVLAGDSVVDRVAVNPSVRESLLAPATEAELRTLVGPGLAMTEGGDEWLDAVFVSRQGPELWRWLLLAALVLLVAESWLAAAGPTPSRRAPSPRSPSGGPSTVASS